MIILSLKYGINWTINIEVGDFFFLGGGVCLRPINPLEGVLGGHLLKNFPRGGGGAQILSLRGGGGQTP